MQCIHDKQQEAAIKPKGYPPALLLTCRVFAFFSVITWQTGTKKPGCARLWWCGWCNRRVSVPAVCACACGCPHTRGRNRDSCMCGQIACCGGTACAVPCRAGWPYQGSWLLLPPFLDCQAKMFPAVATHPAGTDFRRINHKPETPLCRPGMTAPIAYAIVFQSGCVVPADGAFH